MTQDELRAECAAAFQRLRHGAGRLDITLTPEQEDRFITYCERLLQANRYTNLTAIRDAPGVMSTLFLDSLTLVPVLRRRVDLSKTLRIVDIGAGAGLPSLPLEILFPHWHLTLVESVGKKAGFLQDTVSALGLGSVAVLKARAEDAVGMGLRDEADICLARAVSALPSLVELCAPFTRPGGLLLFPKGGGAQEEISAAGTAASRLGCRLSGVVPVDESLGLGAGRVIVVYEKIRVTPTGFPRRVGLAQHQPLSRS